LSSRINKGGEREMAMEKVLEVPNAKQAA